MQLQKYENHNFQTIFPPTSMFRKDCCYECQTIVSSKRKMNREYSVSWLIEIKRRCYVYLTPQLVIHLLPGPVYLAQAVLPTQAFTSGLLEGWLCDRRIFPAKRRPIHHISLYSRRNVAPSTIFQYLDGIYAAKSSENLLSLRTDQRLEGRSDSRPGSMFSTRSKRQSFALEMRHIP